MASVRENWVTAWGPRSINGVMRDTLTLRCGTRTIEAVELDMADQWDFMEIAGSSLDNEPWVSTALLACSVLSVDGVPQPTGVKSRDAIRAVLRKIGGEGIDALGDAFESRQRSSTDVTSETATQDAVGN